MAKRKKIVEYSATGKEMGTFIEEDDAMPVFKINPVQISDAPLPATAIRMYDAIELDDAGKYAPAMMVGGYIKAMPRVARTGIQVYRGDECGRPDLEMVRVYRPEDSVFHKDALSSLTHLPLTLEHPKTAVTSANWKDFAVGETGEDILRDGGTIRVPMILRDAKAIAAFKSGSKNQLSVGYDCDLAWESGKTTDGEEYDAVQKSIRGNHIAIVGQARGGPTLNLGDDNIGETDMNTVNLKNVMVDGIEVQMTDTAAQIVQRTINSLTSQIDGFEKKIKKAGEDCEDAATQITTLTTESKAKDAEIATLKSQLKDSEMTPAKLDALVKDRQAVIDKATSFMGKTFKTDGLDVTAVRRAVVDTKLGDVAKGWDDNQIAASFNTLTAGVKTSDPIKDASVVFGQPHRSSFAQTQDGDTRQALYDGYDKDKSEAWRGAKAS